MIDILHRLRADLAALRMMLALLEREGQVRKLPGGTACPGGCGKCNLLSVELYEWLDDEHGIIDNDRRYSQITQIVTDEK